MKRTTLTFLLVFASTFYNCSIAQVDTNKIQSLVDKLSWNSITKETIWHSSYFTFEDTIVKELLTIGKPTTKYLIDALLDSNKTVIAHIILNEIWKDHTGQFSIASVGIFKNCNQPVGRHRIYEGLVWEVWLDNGKTKNSIRPEEIAKIKLYWTKRITKNVNAKFNWTDIYDELEILDNLLYPCKK